MASAQRNTAILLSFAPSVRLERRTNCASGDANGGGGGDSNSGASSSAAELLDNSGGAEGSAPQALAIPQSSFAQRCKGRRPHTLLFEVSIACGKCACCNPDSFKPLVCVVVVYIDLIIWA